MTSPDPDFIAIFLEEAKDLLADWEKRCLDLERGAEQGKIDALFRVAHNLKGSSRSVGLEQFGGLVHRAEDVITLLRSHSIPLTPHLIRLLLDVQSCLSAWSERLA